MSICLMKKKISSINVFWVFVFNKGKKNCIAKYNFKNFRNKELKINYFKLNYFLSKSNLKFSKSSIVLLQKGIF